MAMEKVEARAYYKNKEQVEKCFKLAAMVAVREASKAIEKVKKQVSDGQERE